MSNTLKYFCVLALCWVSSAYPSSSNRQCNQFNIAEIKAKYIKKIWEEADDLNKLSEIIEDVTEEVGKKLRKLEEALKQATEFAESKGFDINQCLDLNYYNQIPTAVEQQLEAYRDQMDQRSEVLFAYVENAVSKVEDCTLSQVSCKQIKKCAENVEDDFDDDVIEDGVDELERYSDSFEHSTIRQITTDINSITKTVRQCYYDHLHTKTSTTTESEENVTDSETDTTETTTSEIITTEV